MTRCDLILVSHSLLDPLKLNCTPNIISLVDTVRNLGHLWRRCISESFTYNAAYCWCCMHATLWWCSELQERKKQKKCVRAAGEIVWYVDVLRLNGIVRASVAKIQMIAREREKDQKQSEKMQQQQQQWKKKEPYITSNCFGTTTIHSLSIMHAHTHTHTHTHSHDTFDVWTDAYKLTNFSGERRAHCQK